jgi:hypothetical protein
MRHYLVYILTGGSGGMGGQRLNMGLMPVCINSFYLPNTTV